jgi:hypothetical protein
MVDYLFGTPPTIRSLACNGTRASQIEQLISGALEASGGARLLHELAVFGAVYGFVDIALRTPAGEPEDSASAPSLASGSTSVSNPRPVLPSSADPGKRSDEVFDRALAAVRFLQLEAVEAPRVVPVLEENDYRRVRYWIQRYVKPTTRMKRAVPRWFRLPWTQAGGRTPEEIEVVEILGGDWWQRYENRQLVAEGPNPLGCLPVVHIQNLSQPCSYAGTSDVEPLIPLQDELNTRLSDRASRVTYQSFKMYLGKGIDDFLERPVGPGQMWSTPNPEATIEEFGSDQGSPSEDSHIAQVREALDKVSGVTPLAAGLIRGNVGNLSSATALRVLLSGLLSRTVRKRETFGQGLAEIASLVLHWLDISGIYHTRPDERRVEIHWPSPLPADEGEQLRNARIKAQLGVPTERILAELGYGEMS